MVEGRAGESLHAYEYGASGKECHNPPCKLVVLFIGHVPVECHTRTYVARSGCASLTVFAALVAVCIVLASNAVRLEDGDRSDLTDW